MKPVSNILLLFILLVLFQGCNTLYNSRTIDIEIVEPGKTLIAPENKIIAIKYNNCNVEYNPVFANYIFGEKKIIDEINTDSIASKVYYELFLENIINQNYFDSIVVLNETDYSDIQLIDALILNSDFEQDSVPDNPDKQHKEIVRYFTHLITQSPVESKIYTKSKIIDPKLGLYSKQELKEIADSTNADILLSLDYYSSLDDISYYPDFFVDIETVHIMTFWNIYDLKNQKLQNFHLKLDTISWQIRTDNIQYQIERLPSHKDAVLNAADIAGNKFAEYIIPHWKEVNRMYYHSNQVDLKKADKLVKENKWMEAAKIWKTNINNPNINIAAKCKFNMGLACEMQNDFDAAIDWIVQSFHDLGQKNEVHYNNCMSYIRVLSQRKLDIKYINLQLKAESWNLYNQ
jgi:hypothetical protein